MRIVTQIEELRRVFNTKFIFDSCLKEKLDDEEMNTIIDILHQKKIDGSYKISKDLELHLLEGKATIIDKDD